MAETMERIEDRLALRNRIVGVLLRNARERAEKTKRECAEALGVSTSTFTAYEEGRKPISLPELEMGLRPSSYGDESAHVGAPLNDVDLFSA